MRRGGEREWLEDRRESQLTIQAEGEALGPRAILLERPSIRLAGPTDLGRRPWS